jgi:glycosyltransferase involved in cell wall biosynthesis
VFCLKAAKSRKFSADEIWILGGPVLDAQSFSPWYPNASVKTIVTDETSWPLANGNNAMLKTPYYLYDAVRSGSDYDIFTTLAQAPAYFTMMARAGGLIGKNCTITQTCYLPQFLKSPGTLELPFDFADVVDADLERWCAMQGEHLFVSHPQLIGQISDKLNTDGRNIKSVSVRENAKQVEMPDKHLLFAGEPSTLFGFDTFIELVEMMADKISKVSVLLHKGTENARMAKLGKKRLGKLKIDIDWREDWDGSALPVDWNGVFVAPARAPLFPLSAQYAQNAGLPIIWGTGFDNPHTDGTDNIYPCTSDRRKLFRTFCEIWQLDLDKNKKAAPAKIPSAVMNSPAISKPRRKEIRLVSVIITHHNRSRLLKETLLSLAAQTSRDYEIIIVDDGSEQTELNAVEKLLEEFSFPNVKISPIDNSYPAAARNHGAMIAKGDALLFVDDDNLIAPQAIAAFRSALAGNDLVSCFYQSFDSGTVPKLHDSGTMYPEQVTALNGFTGAVGSSGLYHNLLGNSFFMVRTEIFKSLGGFSPKYGVGFEDYSFLMRAAMRHDLRSIILPEPYLYFRRHGNKIRHSHTGNFGGKTHQASHWRFIEEIADANVALSGTALGYARQLHEIAKYQYLPERTPKYLRLRSILKHLVVLPKLKKVKTSTRRDLGSADPRK